MHLPPEKPRDADYSFVAAHEKPRSGPDVIRAWIGFTNLECPTCAGSLGETPSSKIVSQAWTQAAPGCRKVAAGGDDLVEETVLRCGVNEAEAWRIKHLGGLFA